MAAWAAWAIWGAAPQRGGQLALIRLALRPSPLDPSPSGHPPPPPASKAPRSSPPRVAGDVSAQERHALRARGPAAVPSTAVAAPVAAAVAAPVCAPVSAPIAATVAVSVAATVAPAVRHGCCVGGRLECGERQRWAGGVKKQEKTKRTCRLFFGTQGSALLDLRGGAHKPTARQRRAADCPLWPSTCGAAEPSRGSGLGPSAAPLCRWCPACLSRCRRGLAAAAPHSPRSRRIGHARPWRAPLPLLPRRPCPLPASRRPASTWSRCARW
jgi:hypothetical protein